MIEAIISYLEQCGIKISENEKLNMEENIIRQIHHSVFVRTIVTGNKLSLDQSAGLFNIIEHHIRKDKK